MIKEPSSSATWTSRRRLAWLLRVSTVLVPLAVAVAAMVAVAHLVTRPRHGLIIVGWYALLLAVSYGASWGTRRLMDRTLPLAALLEMSLTFPESAPSRLGLAQRNGSADELVRLATARPDETTQDAAERILKLLTALSVHDRFTRGHAERVRAYTDLIAEKMGLPPAERERLRWAALLHDIGKLRVPAPLLNKPGKPTPAEWDLLKQHPTQGSVIAAPLLAWLQPMDRVIAEHHEKFDGTGYPVGLAGEAISAGARIVTVADCFEAMTAARSYSRPMKREAALAELVRCAGTQFDPVVVRALLAVPQRRLLWAMGPTAWLAGLPFLGQGSLGVLRTAATHAGTAALSAGAVVVVAVTPGFVGTPTTTPPPAAALQPVRTASPVQVVATPVPLPQPNTGAPATTTHAPAPVRATPSPRPTPAPPPTPTHPPTHPPTHRPAPTSTARRAPRPAPTTSQQRTAAPTPTRTPSPTHTPTPTHPAAPVHTTTPTTMTPTTAAPTHPAAPAAPTHPAIPAPTTTPAPRVTTAAPVHSTAPAAPTTTAAPTTAVPTTPAAPAAAALSCSATYTSTTGSDHQLIANITVTNTGTVAGTGWTVTWTWPSGDQRITSWYNAMVSQNGRQVTADNDLFNASGPPGASTTFGISGKGNAAKPVPTLTCVQH